MLLGKAWNPLYLNYRSIYFSLFRYIGLYMSVCYDLSISVWKMLTQMCTDWDKYINLNIHTHTHARTHTLTHTVSLSLSLSLFLSLSLLLALSRTQSLYLSDGHTYTHTHIPTVFSQSLSHIHNTFSFRHTLSLSLTHTLSLSFYLSFACIRIHIHILTFSLSYTYTHTHTYIYIYMCMCVEFGYIHYRPNKCLPLYWWTCLSISRVNRSHEYSERFLALFLVSVVRTDNTSPRARWAYFFIPVCWTERKVWTPTLVRYFVSPWHWNVKAYG